VRLNITLSRVNGTDQQATFQQAAAYVLRGSDTASISKHIRTHARTGQSGERQNRKFARRLFPPAMQSNRIEAADGRDLRDLAELRISREVARARARPTARTSVRSRP